MLTAILILCFFNTACIATFVGLKIYDNSRYETVVEDENGEKIDDGLVNLLGRLL